MLLAMRATLLIVVLVASAAQATEVYRWVDASGQAHYSDRWRPGAEKLRLEVSPGFSAPPPAQQATAADAEPAAATSRYESLRILSPAQEEVLWNIEGQLRVSVQVTPRLLPGHSLRLYLDNGLAAELSPGSTQADLQNVYRGVHTLKAEVADASGQALASSPAVTFAVRQTSIQNPQNPLTPALPPAPPPVPTPR
jgi:hypothetical protein